MIDGEEMKKALLVFHDLKAGIADRFARAKVIRHDNYQLPERPRYMNAMAFIQMADTYTSGLIGEINRFLIGIVHADAWVQVAQKYEKPDDLSLLWEFAEPQLELSVGRPYSIRNQFIFAAVRLLHQSKQLRDPNWRDDLPEDKRINYKLLENLNADWKLFPEFVRSLEQLNDAAFVKNTIDFRHRLQHRFRSELGYGLTRYIDREITPAGVSYNFGVISPLPLEILVPELYRQHEAAATVFGSYWSLLSELCQAWDERHACSQ